MTDAAMAQPAAPSAGPSAATPAAIIAAVLLPPLGVWLMRGTGADFWIAVVLTCLGYLPGVIWALVAVLRGRPLVRRRG